ncbi:MAG TPA: hypothetical protein VGR57_12655 [Ktedonobacterales bacterium]|nr:hypothetical protein [Ktedonobacterales bacterium]
MVRRYLVWAVVCGMLVLALAGCGLPATARAATMLRVTRTSHYLPGVDRTITDPVSVQRLLGAVPDLRRVPEGEYYCPVDLGTEYHLAFITAGASPTKMLMDGSGCRFIRIEPSGPTYFQTDEFRALFSAVTGIRLIEPRQPTG